ncbi:MAG: hypothetical protein ACOCPV_03650 [Halodesulfurarchaeum sp.]
MRELLALAVVPAVLIVVFTLPTETKRELAFSYMDPTPLTAFTAHYVHLAPTHLWGNVFAFVLLAGTGYVLAVLADRRQLFGLAVLFYLFVFPPVLSLLNLAVPREAITYGFSGINMAMAGFLPLALTLYAGRRLLERVDHRQAPTLFFLAMALIALIAIPLSVVTAAVAVAAGGAAIGYGYTAYTGVATTERSRALRLAPGAERSGWVELGAISAFVAMGYPLVGFPAEPAAGGTVMNLYVHFLGYSLAFLVPYISLETGLLDGL